MPIYEFYCGKCHTVFNFLSKTVTTTKRPACPVCGRPDLDRQVSRFAISKGRKASGPQDTDLPDLDEARMERVLDELSQEAEGLNEDDPRQVARMLRKLQQHGGLPADSRFEDALRRLEAGADPEQLESELGELLDADGELGPEPLRNLTRKLRPPRIDETLYDM